LNRYNISIPGPGAPWTGLAGPEQELSGPLDQGGLDGGRLKDVASLAGVAVGPGVPTAAFCTNDLLALGLLRRLSQLGAQVPGDLAIVGYDDIDFAADSAVPLTSIRQPKYELGQTAAQLILEEADAPAEHEHRRFVFTPELITRASSQPEPARPAPES
jgi:hypothetical protein